LSGNDPFSIAWLSFRSDISFPCCTIASHLTRLVRPKRRNDELWRPALDSAGKELIGQ
jgi:hypothetical protein